MTRFYTKKGDDGYTSILGKGRAPKYDHRIETVGTIDEANAAIALARTLCHDPQTTAILISVQKDLYHLMAEVSATPQNAPNFRKINTEKVSWLENQIDNLSAQVTIPDEFILPGDTQAGAAIDLARTIVRRAERRLARMFLTKKIENHELLHYMNRLSSLFFILELLENKAAGINKATLNKDK
jgi:cob(I)alamin adenosyltransferase